MGVNSLWGATSAGSPVANNPNVTEHATGSTPVEGDRTMQVLYTAGAIVAVAWVLLIFMRVLVFRTAQLS